MKNIQDSLESATEAKIVFGDNYQMYCDWCAQFGTGVNRTTGKRSEIRVRPQPEEVFSNIAL